MTSRFFVAPIWRWVMFLGFLGGVGGLFSFLWMGQYHSLVVVGAFLLYCLGFLVRYTLHPYIEITNEAIQWILPPFFWRKRLAVDRIVEIHGEGKSVLFLVTRDGSEITIPVGFLRPHERRAVSVALEAALPTSSLKEPTP